MTTRDELPTQSLELAREELATVLAERDGCACPIFPHHRPQCPVYDWALGEADALLASPALARLLNEARAEAWDEGVREASPHGGAYLRSLYATNPYRKETP